MAVKGGSSGGSSGAIKAGAAFVSLFTDDTMLTRGLARAEKRLAAFAQSATVAGAGLAGAGGGILGGLAGAATASLDRAVDLSRLAGKLGVSTEDLSAMAYAASTAGVSIEELEGHFENFAERVAQAANGTGEGAESFKKLGIDAKALAGQSSIQQLETLADAMLKVGNNTERLGILSQLGGDQFQKLNVILKGGSAGLRELRGEAQSVGAVLTTEQAERAMQAQLNLNRAWTAGKSILYTLGDAIIQAAGPIQDYIPAFLKIISQTREWITENRGLVGTIAGVGAALAVAGVALTGVGVGISAILTAGGAAIAVVTGLWSVVTAVAPLALAAAAIIGVAYAVYEFSDSAKEATGAVGKFFGELVRGPLAYFGLIAETFEKTWGGIKGALMSGDIKLAGQIAWAGLLVEFRRAVVVLNEVWAGWASTYVDQFFDAIATVKIGLNDGLTYIRVGFADATNYLLKQWDSFGTSVGSILTRAAEVGIAALWEYVKNLIEGLKAAAGAAGITLDNNVAGAEKTATEAKAIHDARAKAQTDILDKLLKPGSTREELIAANKAANAEILATAKAEQELRHRMNAERVAAARAELELAKANLEKFLGMVGTANAPLANAAQNKLANLGNAAGPMSGIVSALVTGGLGRQMFGGATTIQQKQLNALIIANEQNKRMIAVLEKFGDKALVFE